MSSTVAGASIRDAISGLEARMARPGSCHDDARVHAADEQAAGAQADRLRRHPAVSYATVDRSSIRVRFTGAAIREAGERLGAGDQGILAPPTPPTERYLVKFGDPNATKALHVGHLRVLAVGNALAELLSFCGASVRRISMVCDTGRSMAEAIAGYLAWHADATPASAGLRGDELVGRCYRDYARTSEATPAGDDPDADAHVHPADAAGDVEAGLRDQAPEILQTWRRLRDWVMAGHGLTLGRLDIAAPEPLFESDALPGVEQALRHGLDHGAFERRPDGMIAFPRAHADAADVVLCRADGAYTAHLRHLVLWLRLQETEPTPVPVVNVVGLEWIPELAARESALRLLRADRVTDAGHRVPVAHVHCGGQPMKSRTGPVVLLEHALDVVERDVIRRGLTDDPREAAAVAACVAKCFFLRLPPTKPIELGLDDLLDDRRNPGWGIATAWLRSARSPTGDADRQLVLQALELPDVWRAAVRRLAPAVVVAHLRTLAATWSATDGRRGGAAAHAALSAGLRSVGALPMRSAG